MSSHVKCPTCRSDTVKVIYFGLPGRLCEHEECGCLSGLASWAPPVSGDGETFAFTVYEGSYWLALWHWLRGDVER